MKEEKENKLFPIECMECYFEIGKSSDANRRAYCEDCHDKAVNDLNKVSDKLSIYKEIIRKLIDGDEE